MRQLPSRRGGSQKLRGRGAHFSQMPPWVCRGGASSSVILLSFFCLKRGVPSNGFLSCALLGTPSTVRSVEVIGSGAITRPKPAMSSSRGEASTSSPTTGGSTTSVGSASSCASMSSRREETAISISRFASDKEETAPHGPRFGLPTLQRSIDGDELELKGCGLAGWPLRIRCESRARRSGRRLRNAEPPASRMQSRPRLAQLDERSLC